jgi:opacity protein-like surface antigen
MKAVRVLFAAIGLAALSATAAQAQVTPLTVEARVGAAIPTGDFGDLVDTGYGLSLHGAYRVIPMIDLYGAYNWTRFGFTDTDEEFGDTDVDLTDSGFELGVRLNVPVPGIRPWVQAGVLLHQLSMSASEGGITGSLTSDREVGFQAAAGVAIPVAPGLRLTPAVSYRQYTVDFWDASSDVSYFGVSVGLRLGL